LTARTAEISPIQISKDLLVVGVPFFVSLGDTLLPVQSILGRGIWTHAITRRAAVARLDRVVLETEVPVSMCVAELG
jgi:hypothetical protein